jgi:RNA polymerase sigma-70 factor, ECF subfamily
MLTARTKRPREEQMDGSQQSHEPGDITRLLREASQGNRDAFDRLVPLVYGELSVLARHKLRSEPAGHTLNTTALVHEAYLKLVDQTRAQWHGRHQFFAVASEAMRRILIDYAKRRKAGKRGGGQADLPIDDVHDLPSGDLLAADEAEELLALDEALTRLAQFNPQGAQIVQYRFFGGLTNEEVAELMGTSARTVRRSWTVAKAWLRRELGARLDADSAILRVS